MIDQGLKERLTGAVVLMVAAVIFVPWLLDGPQPAQPAMEQRSLELPAAPVPATGKAQPQKSASANAEARQVEKPVTRKPADEQASAKQAADRPPPTQPVAEVPADPLSAWAVQVGSFASKDNAERLSATLKERGYRAFVTRANEQGKTFYRVRVGPEQERARAEALAQRLQKDGQKTAVLRHP